MQVTTLNEVCQILDLIASGSVFEVDSSTFNAFKDHFLNEFAGVYHFAGKIFVRL